MSKNENADEPKKLSGLQRLGQLASGVGGALANLVDNKAPSAQTIKYHFKSAISGVDQIAIKRKKVLAQREMDRPQREEQSRRSLLEAEAKVREAEKTATDLQDLQNSGVKVNDVAWKAQAEFLKDAAANLKQQQERYYDTLREDYSRRNILGKAMQLQQADAQQHQSPCHTTAKNATQYTQVTNYQNAVAQHQEQTSKNSFMPLGDVVDNIKGTRTITWVDPRLSEMEKKDPKNHVTYTYDRQGKMSINCGSEVSCVLPPIQKEEDKGFEVVQVIRGKPGYLHENGTGKSSVSISANGTKVEPEQLRATGRTHAQCNARINNLSETEAPSYNATRSATQQQTLSQGRL